MPSSFDFGKNPNLVVSLPLATLALILGPVASLCVKKDSSSPKTAPFRYQSLRALS